MTRDRSSAISDQELNSRLNGRERTNELTVMPLLGHSVRGGAVDLCRGQVGWAARPVVAMLGVVNTVRSEHLRGVALGGVDASGIASR